MIFKTIFVCFSLVLVHGQGNSTKLQIVNGQEAAESEAKFAVFITERYEINGQKKKGNCGGTLIGKKTVLTAAHCFQKTTSYYKTDKDPKGAVTIRYGSHDKTKGIEISAKRIRIHPGFVEKIAKDIAIIRLDQAVTLESGNIARLPAAGNHKYEPDTKVTVYGWGDTTEDRRGICPDTLMKTTMSIVQSKKGEGELIRAQNKDSATCQGDSGGPLVVNQNKLIGVLSAGVRIKGQPENCNKGKVTKFTKVESFLDWIKDNV